MFLGALGSCVAGIFLRPERQSAHRAPEELEGSAVDLPSRVARTGVEKGEATQPTAMRASVFKGSPPPFPVSISLADGTPYQPSPRSLVSGMTPSLQVSHPRVLPHPPCLPAAAKAMTHQVPSPTPAIAPASAASPSFRHCSSKPRHTPYN